MRMKKIASLLLALVLVLAMAVPAFADAGEGKITITNAQVDQEYKAYLMFDLESYDPVPVPAVYAYKVHTGWEDFVNDDLEGKKFFVISNGYVMKRPAAPTDTASLTALAKAAVAYAKRQEIGATATLDSANNYSQDNLPLGYYCVDSTVGTLCSLNTAATEAKIEDKNPKPTNEKTVEEDSTTKYGAINDAEIGQTVKFKSEVKIPVGSKGVIFHDEMSNGLTLNKNEGDIKVFSDEDLQTELAAGSYSVRTPGTCEDAKCTFEVEFTTDYLNNLTAETTVYVGYTAKLNDQAVIAGAGNPNSSKISYGANGHQTTTPPSTTKTYTWQFGVLKYANGGKRNVLKGVDFVLLNESKNKYAKIVNGKMNGWGDVPAPGADGKIDWYSLGNAILTTDDKGNIAIKGVDADTYMLREVKTLAGYNLLTEDTPVRIGDSITTSNQDKTMSQATIPVSEIENQSGTVMPSTGGIGTTIFYVVGSILLVGAAVLLITKRRMNSEK